MPNGNSTASLLSLRVHQRSFARTAARQIEPGHLSSKASRRSAVPAKIRYVPASPSINLRDIQNVEFATNPSAMTALAALTQTQSSLNQVENQISTGKRIASAADNASYWSIATKMESNVGALGSVNDALSESASLTGTMSAAMSQAISVVKKIKNDLVEASNPGADLNAIQSDIAAQQSSLLSIGESANFNGQNWLATTAPGNVSLVASYDSKNG